MRLSNPARIEEFNRLRTGVAGDHTSFAPFVKTSSIFVHIPKTAGIAVSDALYGEMGGAHAAIDDYMLAFSRREFTNFFKFGFVRNPWDRLVSAYEFLRGGALSKSDYAWYQREIENCGDFKNFVIDWLSSERLFDSIFLIPQYKFVCYPLTTKCALDFMGRYETLDRDFATISKRLSIKVSLSALNVSKRESMDYRSYYDSAARDKVAEIYKVDVEKFQYRFDG